MADIELVIKIPEEMWERVKEGYVPLGISKYLRSGIPLPKGHGRLFDERDIVNGNCEVIGNRIYEVEPVIEADIESEDK